MRQLFTILILGVGLSHAQTTYVQACSFVSAPPVCKWVPSNYFVGPSGTVTIGTVETLPAGSQATVKNVGTPQNAVLNFGIPAGRAGIDGINGTNGINGTAATIAVGSVVTLPSGSPAVVRNSGTSSVAVFDFSIPMGPQGAAWQPPSGITFSANNIKVVGTITVCDPAAPKCPQWMFAPKVTSPTTANLAGTVAP